MKTPPLPVRPASTPKVIPTVTCPACHEFPDVSVEKGPGALRVAISHDCKRARMYVARLFYFDPGRPETDPQIVVRGISDWNKYVRTNGLARAYDERLEIRDNNGIVRFYTPYKGT